MTKKDKVSLFMSYYDQRDENNEFVTPDGRKYKFPTFSDSECFLKPARERIEKIISDGLKEPRPSYNRKATPSSWFLSEMEKHKERLKELLQEGDVKLHFYKDLRSSILSRKDYNGERSYGSLRYEDFEWACLTIPRAWLQ